MVQTMSQSDHSKSEPSPRYYYPSVPVPQRPLPAHLSHGRALSEAQRTDPSRVYSSVSSAESGSSGTSVVVNQYPSHAYWQASVIEQGLMNEKKRSSWPDVIEKDRTHTPPTHEMEENNSAVLKYIQENQNRGPDEEEREDDHAIWILFWLSCLDPIHSLISAVYTLLVVLTLSLAYPIRICKSQESLGVQLIRALAPNFRHHLEQLYAPSVEDAYTFDFRPVMLVLVQLASPILSIGIMLSAWVAAAFWLFAIIMGNPDGTEKGDDGRNTVLLVRDWWERYFLSAIRDR